MEIHILLWSVIFFVAAASFGLYMLIRVFRRLQRQTAVMLLHGIFAGFGVGLLFYFSAFERNSEVPYGSIFFFIVAVFGGVFMVMWDKIMIRKMPRLFPLIHASAAVTGLILLVFYMLRHNLF